MLNSEKIELHKKMKKLKADKLDLLLATIDLCFNNVDEAVDRWLAMTLHDKSVLKAKKIPVKYLRQSFMAGWFASYDYQHDMDMLEAMSGVVK